MIKRWPPIVVAMLCGLLATAASDSAECAWMVWPRTRGPGRLSGPKRPTKSSPASLDFVIESLTQDTSSQAF
jgi:hypothetical protein